MTIQIIFIKKLIVIIINNNNYEIYIIKEYLIILKMLYYSHPVSFFDISLMTIVLILIISLVPKNHNKIE